PRLIDREDERHGTRAGLQGPQDRGIEEMVPHRQEEGTPHDGGSREDRGPIALLPVRVLDSRDGDVVPMSELTRGAGYLYALEPDDHGAMAYPVLDKAPDGVLQQRRTEHGCERLGRVLAVLAKAGSRARGKDDGFLGS